MSLSSEVKRNDYVGNGSASSYNYTFRIFDEDHVIVVVRNPDTDVETTLDIDDDYTVTGVGSTGGTIELVDDSQAWIDVSGNLDDDWIITILRDVPQTQETDLRNQGDFFPETHEDALDKLTMIAQQMQDELDRSVKLPISVSSDDFDTELPAGIVDQVEGILGVDGGAIVLYEVSDVAAMSAQTSHSITESQSATDLTGETLLAADYTSAVYNYQIIRGTTVFSTGTFSLHYRDGAWYVAVGEERKEDAAPQHGVTFSVTGTTTAQLKAAVATDGVGDGTIKLKRHRFSA